MPSATGQNYLLQSTTPLNSDIFSTHVLHTINAKFNVNGGYNFNSQRSHTLSNFADIGGHQSTRSQSVDLGLSHNWSPRLVENLAPELEPQSQRAAQRQFIRHGHRGESRHHRRVRLAD